MKPNYLASGLSLQKIESGVQENPPTSHFSILPILFFPVASENKL